MTQSLPDEIAGDLVGEDTSEIELTDDDILDAMQHIPHHLCQVPAYPLLVVMVGNWF